MMIFKKSMARRTFLRGAGTALALPLLDAMVPAFATAADTASRKATLAGPDSFRFARALIRPAPHPTKSLRSAIPR